jgi:hypothetical protein
MMMNVVAMVLVDSYTTNWLEIVAWTILVELVLGGCWMISNDCESPCWWLEEDDDDDEWTMLLLLLFWRDDSEFLLWLLVAASMSQNDPPKMHSYGCNQDSMLRTWLEKEPTLFSHEPGFVSCCYEHCDIEI